MENNLLTDRWLTVETPDGTRKRLSLPELFSAMERNEVASFPEVLPHQSAPWHVFLVQLACHCLEKAGKVSELPSPDRTKPWAMLGQHRPDEWLAMIRGIVPEYFQKYPHDEPWCLVTSDLSKPAFMQVPLSEKNFKDYKGVEEYPDDLDLLISSKNFDVKSGTTKQSSAESWIFALVSMQTNSGYLGAGNYQIARQYAAYGKRPVFTLQSFSSPGARWGRDAFVILNCPDDWEFYTFCRNEKDMRLLWLEPWDGTTSCALRDLHPLFIEICRRLRAVRTGDKLAVKKAASKCSRVDIGQTGGNLRDPWEPVVIDKKGCHVFCSDLNYANMAKIFAEADGIQKPLLLRYHSGIDSSSGAKAWCSALVKGRGKTEGYVERLIPIDTRGDIDEETQWSVSSTMIDLVKTAKNKVLGVALGRFMCCGTSADGRGAINWNSTELKNWLPPIKDGFEKEIDSLFFKYLWAACSCFKDEENSDGSWLAPWKECLVRLVRKYYDAGVSSLPGSSGQGLKARALSSLTLEHLIATHLKTSVEEAEA